MEWLVGSQRRKKGEFQAERASSARDFTWGLEGRDEPSQQWQVGEERPAVSFHTQHWALVQKRKKWKDLSLNSEKARGPGKGVEGDSSHICCLDFPCEQAKETKMCVCVCVYYNYKCNEYKINNIHNLYRN